MMSYIHIKNALPLRDRDRRLHAITGPDPDGNWVWRSEEGDQVIQTTLTLGKQLVITRFQKLTVGGKTEYRFLDEQSIPIENTNDEKGV